MGTKAALLTRVATRLVIMTATTTVTPMVVMATITIAAHTADMNTTLTRTEATKIREVTGELDINVACSSESQTN